MQLLKHRFGPFMVCLLLVIAGCATWRQVGGPVFRFNHEKMLHQSLECTDCHTEVLKGAKAGMPVLETCLDCHEDIDKRQPPERQVTSLFDKNVYKATNATAIPAEVIFSHKNHTVDQKIACADCHIGIKDSTSITKEVRVDMKACITCHAKVDKPGMAADDCATCHQTIRKEVKPETHQQNWSRFHGQKAKDGDQEGQNQCSLCHTQESCTTCHKTQAPTNHTNLWRERGHGVTASMNRESCTTCHQSDTCNTCHQSTAPRNHSGQWGGPTDKHCQNCHVPVSRESCALCHQNGTPSHAKATPTPANMIGTNCRACHGTAPNAKLPHIDNGDDCNSCHK